MKYTNLGKCGLRVSRICFGAMSFGTNKAQRAWIVDEETSRTMVRKALDAGVNFFDTAETYQNGESEEILGRALKALVPHREDVVIATKVFAGTAGMAENRWGLSRKHILHEIDQSLKRLGTDYIDLYQIHRFDKRTPIAETLDALTDCVRAGKVRYIGASSMWAWQFERALATSEKFGYVSFVSMQNHYNLVYREEEREMMPLCIDRGIGVIPWSPLARGFLAGNRSRSGPLTKRAETDHVFKVESADQENNFAILDRLIEVSKRLGKPTATVALAWLLAQPGVTAPIVGASRLDQLDDTLNAADLVLSPEDIAYLSALYRPHKITGHS